MRLETYKMAASIFLKFLTLKCDISRTIWRIEVSDGSLFCIFHALSFELNLFFDRTCPLRDFLSQLEAEKITKVRNAADSNEKLFWRLLKGQRSISQMTAFLVDGKLITDKKQIREVWADHFGQCSI